MYFDFEVNCPFKTWNLSESFPRLMCSYINSVWYLVVLHPHVIGLVPGVLDSLRSVSPPQGLRGELARGQVGGAPLLLRLR